MLINVKNSSTEEISILREVAREEIKVQTDERNSFGVNKQSGYHVACKRIAALTKIEKALSKELLSRINHLI